jgi:hypothetical protein
MEFINVLSMCLAASILIVLVTYYIGRYIERWFVILPICIFNAYGVYNLIVRFL